MERFKTKILLLLPFLSVFSSTMGQTDSTWLSGNLYGKSFFDNKEFTGSIKKGYTHPGFFLQPGINLSSGQFDIQAGFHLLYLAGSDTLERLVPFFSAKAKLSQGVVLVAGTINSKYAHWLPEPLYKPERLLLNQPETGIQFLYQGNKSKADLWINWERYIKTGSPFQEEFTVGFSHLYNTGSKDYGFGNNFYALAFHKGGQIDSTNLPVQTIVNVSVAPSYTFSNGFGIYASVYFYKNFSPSAVLKYDHGVALYPKFIYNKNKIRVELGQWFANGFINPRGEELFGSLSTISPNYDEKRRLLTTFSVMYEKKMAKGLALKAIANAYYDINASTLEYSYTLCLTFDGPIKRF